MKNNNNIKKNHIHKHTTNARGEKKWINKILDK